jgi:DoxX-like protein
MHIAYIIVTLLAAVFVGFSAWALFTHAGFIMEPLDQLKIPRSWWPWLAAAKAAGSVGLVVGMFVPVIGELAAVCLVLYFVGAIITTIRVHWYSHIKIPLIYMAPVVAALALGFGARWPHWTIGG